jgi:serine/threonine-protein kinase
MELIEGETLGDLLKRGPLPPLEAVRIVLDVTHALECGWRTAQLIHRDIKPGNIFLSREGAVKLGDLGLAKTTGSDTTGLTQPGAMMGTPHYISPEQARGDKDLDFRADIYSLGCTLYQMLTGQTPYDGRDPFAVMNMHVNAAPPAILKVLPQCPLPLARLVGKMLRKQRRERHASYEELIAQLESVQALLDFTRTVPSASATGAPAEAGPLRHGVPSEATQSTKAEGRRGASSLPKKSSLPRYGGIAAGVLVLGIAG